MKGTQLPQLAALVIFGFAAGLVPGLAQLPPTNMGKYVHQPGDNQYSDQTQAGRHGPGPSAVRPVQVFTSSGYRPAPAPKKPDPTIEPIAADEPIPPAGFPPLPDRLDLPVGVKAGWSGGGGGYGGGGGGYGGGGGGGSGGGGGGGGPAPGMSGGGGPPTPSFHQHYGHVEPGAFQQPKQGVGYYKAIDPGLPAKQSGGQGYYKAIDPGLPAKQSGGGGYYKVRTPGSDYYGSSGEGGAGAGGPGGPPAYTGASARDFKSLGKEPKINERQEQTQAPDAPTPVVVSQSTTQDLSLPEDEFEIRNAAKNAGRKGKGGGGALKGPLNSVGGLTGVRF